MCEQKQIEEIWPERYPANLLCKYDGQRLTMKEVRNWLLGTWEELETMPFGTRQEGGKVKVVNKETGRVLGTHSSMASAQKQLAASAINVGPERATRSLGHERPGPKARRRQGS